MRCGALVFLLLAATVGVAEPFKDGDTVVFLGDSITHGGRYHGFITDFYRTRYPERKIRFINSGIGGDSAIGAQKRLHEDVSEYRPTHVALHFGMNDIDRGAYTRETTTDRLRRRADAQAKYRKNLDDLITQVKAVAPQAELIYLSTTIYDDTAVATNIPPNASGWATVNQVGCSAGLAQMAGHVLAKAKAEGVLGVDWYTPLNDYLLKRQAADPHFMMTSWDRVHPNSLGHSIMAWAFLEAQGVSPIVSDLKIDAARGVVERCENAAVSEFSAAADGMAFTLLGKSLPMPIAPIARETAADLKIAERLNREILTVAGLAAGRYLLTIDDIEVGVWTDGELAAGINLAMNEQTPQYIQARAVAERNLKLWGEETILRNHHSARWSYYGKTNVEEFETLKAYVAANDPNNYFARFVPGYIAYWPTYRETRARLLERQNEVYALARPIAHRYQLCRLSGGPVVIRVEPGRLTLAEAVRLARAARRADLSAPVSIVLAAGTHELSETILLTDEDSSIVWKGEDGARICGGRRLEGWRLESEDIVSAPLPKDFLSSPQTFNQLWVNGRRAPNSLWPKGGFLSGTFFFQQSETNAAGKVMVRQCARFADPHVRTLLAGLAPEELEAMRLSSRIKWTYWRQLIRSVTPEAGEVVVDSPKLWPPWAMPSGDSRLCFENVRAGFSEPGDWFCDAKVGRVFYRLLPGESPETISAVVPVAGLKTLVRVQGGLAERPVEGLVFSNLTFTVTAAKSQTYGYQAAVAEAAAIEAVGLRGALFVDCRVTGTGGYAFRLEDGCVSNAVVRCRMDDLGAGGLWIGSKDTCLPVGVEVKRAVLKNDSSKACKFNRVEDCLIREGGRVNSEGVGVVIGHASDCTVTHCEIEDFEYSGVSLGWIWGYTGSICQRNEVSFNRIRNLGKGLMDDMAGVYALSTSFGTSISNNVISDVSCSPKGYGGWGLYCDEGAEGIVMENNVTWNTTDGSFHQHYGTGCQIRNNILAYNRRDGAVLATNQDPFQHVPSHVNVYGNIVLVKGKGNPFTDTRTLRVKGPWACNIWWNEDSEPTFLAKGMTLEEWRHHGLEIGGVVADPRFVDAPNHDFRLKPNSPAFALGFREWNLDEAGCRKGDK